MRLEQTVWRAVDVIYHPSPRETEYVEKWLASNRVKAVAKTLLLFVFDAFCEDISEGLSRRSDILFVAGFGHPPNIDAAVWFVQEILPLIRAKRPNVRVSIVGSNPTAEVQSLASPNVLVTGFVTDAQLAEHYNRARVAIAPLRYGAGLKGKVIESMRFGLPMVTTSAGVHGFESGISEAIAVADDSAGFATHVVQLLEDDDRWSSQADAAVKFAKTHFSERTMMDVIAEDFGMDGHGVSSLSTGHKR